jgi:hypothetical protein
LAWYNADIESKGKRNQKMFALRFDGFVQSATYATLAEAQEAWKVAIKNRFWYEYDCVIVEIDENRKSIRVI